MNNIESYFIKLYTHMLLKFEYVSVTLLRNKPTIKKCIKERTVTSHSHKKGKKNQLISYHNLYSNLIATFLYIYYCCYQNCFNTVNILLLERDTIWLN